MKKIALLGFGTVGSGTAQVLTDNRDRVEKALGEKVEIAYILDLREFPDSPFADKIVHDYAVILNDPTVEAVAEMMGGSHPAYEFTKQALTAGKHVVTSNKEVVGKFGAELLRLAAEKGVRYLFEASVGGGIPVLRPLMRDMAANRIAAVNGILNGTSNYVMTRMGEGVGFDEAVAEAQKLGYAERDPSADVDGLDAARKIAILTAVATGTLPNPDALSVAGIRGVTPADNALAASMNCAVKLIGHMARTAEDKLYVWVAPCFVPHANPLANVTGVYNAILVGTDTLGNTLFYGQGAGKTPTAGAVVSDILDVLANPGASVPVWNAAKETELADVAEEKGDFCLIAGSAHQLLRNITGREAKKQLTALGGERCYRILTD